MRAHSKFLLNSTTALILLLNAPHAFAGSITNLGTLGSDAGVTGISANGQMVVGTYTDVAHSNIYSYYWTPSTGLVDMGDLGTVNLTRVLAISGDGTTAVGVGTSSVPSTEAFYWTLGTGMIGIGDLGGGQSFANAVNYDGTVIAGESFDGTNVLAFRWTQGTGMVSLGNLVMGGDSTASAISDDGLVVGGKAINGTGDYVAFRWTSGTGMVDLGTLGGSTSEITAINSDGSVLAGYAYDGNGDSQAIRWTQGTGMISINPTGASSAYATDMTSDGTTIVGNAYGDGFVWTAGTGSRFLSDILTDAGINTTGWVLDSDLHVSNDGSIIAGGGTFNGDYLPFLISLTGNVGIISTEELEKSLLPTISPARQSYSLVSNGIGQSLLVARNALNGYFPPLAPLSGATIDVSNPATISPAAGGDDVIFNPYGRKRTAFYTTGYMGFGQNNDFDNHSANGTAGILIEMNDRFVIGGGLILGHSSEQTHLDGQSQVNSTGLSINSTYEADSGFRFYGTVAASKLDVNSKRNYLNGASIDSSSGKTDGYAYGTSVRVGYELNHAKDELALMPYTELQYSHSQLDSYSETGGAFAADVSKQTGKSFVSLLGMEASQAITPNLTVRGRGAWGHRYTDDNSVTVTAATITQTITGDAGDKNWAELGMTANYKINDKTTLTGDIQTRTSRTSDPMINVGIGFVWNFN